MLACAAAQLGLAAPLGVRLAVQAAVHSLAYSLLRWAHKRAEDQRTAAAGGVNSRATVGEITESAPASTTAKQGGTPSLMEKKL